MTLQVIRERDSLAKQLLRRNDGRTLLYEKIRIQQSILSKGDFHYNQQMDDIAAKLGAQWRTLASQLEMKASELREIETDSEDVDMQAKLLLVTWQDREGTQATVDNLISALSAAGFSQMADGLNEA